MRNYAISRGLSEKNRIAEHKHPRPVFMLASAYSETESINMCIYHATEYLHNKHVCIVLGMSASKFDR